MTSEIIISSRIRLARNFKNLEFPNRINSVQADYVAKEIRKSVALLDYFSFYKTSYNDTDSLALLEERLISKDLLNAPFGACLINKTKEISIMLNEEDHIRIQCIVQGDDLEKAYKKAKKVDDLIVSQNEIAFDEKLGFLTACPTNLGTGMRASCMMFLPALTMLNLINSVISKMNTMSITVRGSAGEGSENVGFLYQISNKTTLGKTPKEIIASVNATVAKLIKLEMQAREELVRVDAVSIADKCKRALGILKHCHVLSSSEFISLLSLVKLGYQLGFLDLNNCELLSSLENLAKPAHLTQLINSNVTDLERDIFRANFVNKNLQKI